MRAGAVLNNVNKLYQTPLMIAAEHRNLAVVRLLLQAGARVNDIDCNGKSALYWAADSSFGPDSAVAIIELLLQAGAKLDSVIEDQRHNKVPLHLAAWEGKLHAVARILEAKVDSRDEFGWTALHEAAAKPGPMSADIIDLLLRAGAEVDGVNNLGLTPLMMSVRKWNTAAAGLLLRAGAKRELRDQQGKSAFDVAMETEMMRLLLSPSDESSSSKL